MLIRTHCLHRLAICVILAFSAIAPACAQARIAWGVNNPRLLTSPEPVWQASLDSMHANGIHLLRTAIGKATLDETLIAFLSYAEKLSIKIDLLYPAERDEYFPPGTPVLPYNGHFPHGRGLAPVETQRFEIFWRAHRTALRKARVHVYAYELGNELNGASFNRDYPIGGDARLLDLQTCDGQPGCATVRQGWDKYLEMLRIMRSSNLLDGSLLLGGSFVPASEGYVQQIHGSFSTVSSTRAYLAAHGADPLLDAYTFHVYPVVPRNATPAKGQQEIARQIGNMFAQCRSSGTKPCWVTEWGFPDQNIQCQDSPLQDVYVRDATAVFKQEASQQGFMEAYYYSWDTNDKHAVYACGHVSSPVIANLLRSD